MIEPSLPAMAGWENFYVIVGSSGAALIGLQFVVIALIKDTRARTNEGTISAFGTPTVVHLGGALLLSAIMSAPWPSVFATSIAILICGLIGTLYIAGVIRHTRRQTGYAPELEDWIWFIILPCVAYVAITIAALTMRFYPRTSLFVIGGASLGLLLIAIHNAWDTVTYIVISADRRDPSDPD